MPNKNAQETVEIMVNKNGRRLLVLDGLTYIPLDKIIAIHSADCDCDGDNIFDPIKVDIYIGGLRGSVDDEAAGAIRYIAQSTESLRKINRFIAEEL